MENLDVIILTIMVAISFVVFIAGSLKEFARTLDKPYQYEKASGFNRATLFNSLSSLFDDDEIPEKSRKKLKGALERTISDMETDGMYFDKTKESFPKDSPVDKPKT